MTNDRGEGSVEIASHNSDESEDEVDDYMF